MAESKPGKLFRKISAFILAVSMMVTSVPLEAFADAAVSYPILLNGRNAAATENVSIAYGEPTVPTLSGYSGTTEPAFTWLPATEQLGAAAQWKAWSDGAPAEPGSYYLGYDFTDTDATTYVNADGRFRFTIVKAVPAAPAGLQWQNGGTAAWSAVTANTGGNMLPSGAVSGYAVTLYRDGTAVTTQQTVAASFDFTSWILTGGRGRYTFSVQAMTADSAHYAASALSAQSGAQTAVLVTVQAGEGVASVTPAAPALLIAGDPAHNSISLTAAPGAGRVFSGWSADAAGAVTFADAVAPATTATLTAGYAGGTALTLTASTADREAPVVTAYAAGAGSDYGTLQASAVDAGSAITQVAFSTATSADAVASADWQAAPANGAGTPAAVRFSVAAAGTYYFYARDAAGNTARSAVGIRASEIDYNGYYNDGAAAARRDFLVGDEPLILAVPTRPGFGANGWHLRSDCSDDAITQVGTHSESAVTVYTQWTRQDIRFTAEPQAYSGVYDGAEHLLTAAVGNTAGTISYQWYKTTDGTARPIEGATAAQYAVKNVADSGSYAVQVTVLLEGSAQTATSSAAEVSITARPLAVAADARTLVYGEAVPTQFYTWQASGFADGEDESVLTGALVCTYDAAGAQSAASVYPITEGSLAAANYSIAFTGAQLTVTPKDGAAGTGMSWTLDAAEQTYTGSDINPGVTVADGARTLAAGTDYTVSYADNRNVGTGRVTLTFIGNYSGTKELTFSIARATYTAGVILAGWTYGEAAGTPDVDSNPGGGAPDYYYYAAGADASAAAAVQPAAAGDYFVYAVLPASVNYEAVTTAPTAFSIARRPIAITADSRSWEYDGNSHSASSYTQAGTFAGQDAFLNVTVIGSITAVGTAVNAISYKLTSATNADNYEITAAPGVLTVTSLALTAPTGCAWRTTTPGTAAWVAVTRDSLAVSYQVELWRTSGGGETQIASVTADSPSYDFAAAIRADTKTAGAAGYRFRVRAVPAGGANQGNYTAGALSDWSAVLYTASVTVSAGSGVASATVDGAQSAILLQGETVTLSAAPQSGYSFFGTVWNEASGKLIIADAAKAMTKARLSDGMTAGAAISLAAASRDDLPVITGFSAATYSGGTRVRFTFSATDSKELTGWALTGSGTEQPATGEWNTVSAAALDGVTADGITAAGTYYLWVRDDGGNAVCSAAGESGTASIDVYRIDFAAGEGGNGSMGSILKVENAAVTLPVSTFARSGYSFRNWRGTTGIYTAGGSYAANASDTLTVQWTDEQFAYTVNYYLMDTTGAYPDASSQTAQFSGTYGKIVGTGSADIALSLKGMQLDAGRAASITLTQSGLSLNVYYQRLQYTVSYRYTLPGETEKTEQQTLYYGAPFTELQKPRTEDYAFVGWIYDGSSKVPETMPNNDIAATGTFVPADASYVIHCYEQDLPANAGAAASYTLAQDLDTTVAALQGDKITFRLSEARQIEGFTAVCVTMSSGAAGGSVPDGAAPSASGTVSATAQLHINVYYTRNSYHLTLNVYDSNLRTNALYTHTEERLYGEAIDAAAFAVCDKANWPDAPEGSILAAYADWSTGSAPSAMPAGDVSVARDYVQAAEVPYQIEVYYETAEEGSYALQSALTYYGYAGAEVTLGGTDDSTVNYNTFSASLYGFSWYQFDGAYAGNVLSGTVSADGTMTLRAYFARKTVTTTITYYYNTGKAENGSATGDIKLANVVKSGKWGTNYTYQPLALFDGTLPADWNGGVYTAADAKAGTFNFRAAGYTVYYNGYYWLDGNHWPSYKYMTAASLTDHANDSGLFGQSGNSLSVYYVKPDPTTHYTVDVVYNPANLAKAGDKTDHDLIAVIDGVSRKVSIANKADIYQSTWTPTASAADIAVYPALASTGGSYTYDSTPVLRDGFSAITANGATYYLNVAEPGIVYVADEENQFYFGNRVGYNFLANSLNAGRLGYDSAENYLASYQQSHSDSSNADTYDARSAGAYIYNSGFSPILYGNGTYRFTFAYADVYTVTYTMGGKSCSDHTYVKNQKVTIGCDNTTAFPAKAGYTICWYTDSACTKPAADFNITQSTILYGSYVRATVTYTVNCYYQLPDGTNITDPAAEGLTAQTGTETVSFTDGTGAVNNYAVPVTRYYRGGVLVMASRRYPVLAYSEVALDYSAYLTDGVSYDDANTGNVIKGYCEASGITLAAYYARQKYTLRVNAGNTAVETITETTCLAGQSVTLGTLTREGYAFAGWTLQKWDGTAWSVWTDAPAEAAQGAAFAMPAANLQAAAVWTPAIYSSTLVHYFETATHTYAADRYAQLAGMAGADALVSFGGVSYAGGKIYMQNGSVLGASLPLDGRAWYFSAAAAGAEAGTYAVETADLIAVSEPLAALSESTFAISAKELDLSGYPMYSFAYAQQTSDDQVSELTADAVCTYGPEASLACYYTRRADYAVTTAGRATDGGESGLTLTGGGTACTYGETMTVRANAAAGYKFLGWYAAADTAFAAPVSAAAEYSFRVTENRDLVALSRPSAAAQPVVTLSGPASYSYGYSVARTNVLSAAITFPDGTDSANKVVSYQWYALAEDGTAAAIPDATSATCLFSTGKACGSYSYRCDVIVRRSDNGRTAAVQSAPYTVTVAPANMSVTVESYAGTYDAADHGVTVNVKKPAAGSYTIYYSDTVLGADNYAQASGTNPVYRDVRMDGTAVGSYTVYYYIHNTDGNYTDLAGSALVTIRPIPVTLSASGSYHKTYDGKTSVSGSVIQEGTQKYNLSNGSSYQIIGLLENEKNLYITDFDADFDSKDVRTAGSLTLRNIRIVSRSTGVPNNNYAFESSYTLRLSGYITPYELSTAWDSDTAFVYSGARQAPGLHLTDTDGLPDAAIASGLTVQGGQINVGNYTAYAAITASTAYELSNYSFSSASCAYTITSRPVTITPDVPAPYSVVYDGTVHRATGFVIGGSGLASTDGVSHTYTAETDRGAVHAGTTSITAQNMHIYQGATDVTDNYVVVCQSADLVIARRPVAVSGFTAANKSYDGNTAASVGTAGLVFAGKVAGDTLAVDASSVSGTFDSADAGAGRTVTVALEQSDLGGSSAADYQIDFVNSGLTCQANITAAAVTVTADAAAVTYGETAVFHAAYSGFVNGETERVVNGSIGYAVQAVGGTAEPYSVTTAAGSYAILPDVSGLTAKNYTFTAAAGTLTVARRPLAVAAAASPTVTKVYDATTAAAAYVGADDWTFAAVDGESASGIANGDTVVLRFAAVYDSKDVSDARTVTLSSLQIDSGNYTLATDTVVLAAGCSITPKALTITANSKKTTYGSAAPEFTVTGTGFAGKETLAVLGGTAAYACAYDTAAAGTRAAGSYTITPSGLASDNYAITFQPGTLMVSRAVLTVAAKAETITYGVPDTVPVYTSSWSGFQYGENASVISGTLATHCSRTTDDLPGTYAGAITPDITGLSADNYTFRSSGAALTIVHHTLTVTGIAVGSKVYDATTSVGAAQIDVSQAVYAGILAGDENSAGLTVTGTYVSANAGEGIGVTLKVGLNAYLAARYTLAAGSQQTATADITRRPLSVTVNSQTIRYGDAEPVYTVSYSGFAAGETSSVLTGSLAYTETYTAVAGSFSPAGSYPVTASGYGADGNYAITYQPGVLTVSPAQLAAPAVGWSSTVPGTVGWTAVSAIGDVAVDHYEVSLVEAVSGSVVAAVTEPAGTTGHSFLEKMRANGAGSYQVRVAAVASETKNEGKASVTDSTEGVSGGEKAAAVRVQFAADAISQAAAVMSGEDKAITIGAGTLSSYVMIAGESGVAIAAHLKNATGYQVGALTADNAALTLTAPSLAGIDVSAFASLSGTLASAQDITVTLTMTARPATAALTLSGDPASAVFGYTAEAAPVISATVVPEAGDNVDASGYTYAYRWYLKEGSAGANTAMTDGTAASVRFPTGKDAGNNRYKVTCEVTATRLDNGQTKTITSLSQLSGGTYFNVVISRASFTAAVSLAGWTYGQPRGKPGVNSNPGGASVTYTFNTDAAAETGWTTVMPKDAGAYFVRAHIAASANYQEFLTQPVAFVIAKAALAVPSNLTISASTAAPYGLLSWDAVGPPAENGGIQPDSTVSVRYRVRLYRADTDAAEDSAWTQVGQMQETTSTSLDLTDSFTQKGFYRFTVQALASCSNGRDNCADSAESARNAALEIKSTVTDSEGTYSKVYDGTAITLRAGEAPQTILGYQWLCNNTTVVGATSDTLALTFVEQSGTYTCRLALEGGGSYYSSSRAVAIAPLALAVTSDTQTKVYDGSPLAGTMKSVVSNLGSGDAALGSGDSIAYTLASRTEAGTAANTITSVTITHHAGAADEKTVFAENGANNNYTLTKTAGMLTVAARSLSDGAGYAAGIAVSQPAAATYDGTTHTPAVIVTDSMIQAGGADKVLVQGTDCTVSYAQNLHAGTAVITVAGRGDYTGTVTRTFSIERRPVTLAAASASRVYNGAALTAASCAPASGFVLGSGDAIDAAGVTCSGNITDAGSTVNRITAVTIRDAGGSAVNDDYALTYSDGTLTIKAIPTPITVTANSSQKTYDGTALTAQGCTYTSGVLLIGDTLQVTVSGSQTAAGESANTVADCKVIRGSTDVTADYTFTAPAAGELTVARRQVTLTSATASKTYDGTALTKNTVAVTGDGWASGEGADCTATGTILDRGTVPNSFTYTLHSGTNADNYTIRTDVGTLTIKAIPTPITVTANSSQKTYDGTTLTAQGCIYTSGVLLIGDTLQVTVSGSQTAAGESANTVADCKVIRGSTDVTADYTFTAPAAGRLTVARRQVTLTSATASKTYDGTALTKNTVAVTGDGWASGEGADCTATGTILDRGTVPNSFTYTLHSGTNADNYTIRTDVGTLTIKAIPTPITVTANSSQKTYDGTALTAQGCTYTSGVLLIGDTLQVTVSGSQTAAGESANTVADCKVMRGSTDVTADYTFTAPAAGRLTVAQKNVVITVASTRKTYGQADPAFSGTVEGLINSSDLGTVTYRRTNGGVSAAGSYPGVLTAVYTDNANYLIRIVPGDFTIDLSAALTVGGTDYSGVYDGASHGTAADANVADGTRILYSTDGGAWNGTVPTITDAGTVEVRVRAENANYVTAESAYTLTVAPKAAKITVNSTGKVYGTEDPAFTGVVEGLVRSGDLGTVIYRRTNNSVNVVGDYPDVLTAEYIANANYTVTLSNGSFRITQSALLTISNPGYSGTYDGQAHGPAAGVSIAAGTAVSYSTDSGATWSNNVPSITGAGTLTVQARAVNPQYITAQCSYTLSVDPRAAQITVAGAQKTYGQTDPAFSCETEGLVRSGDLGVVSARRSNAGTEEAGSYPSVLTADYTVNPNYEVRIVPGDFVIAKADLTPAAEYTVTAPADVLYSGTAQALNPTVAKVGGTALVQDRDFTVARSGDTVNAGTVLVTVTGTGNYEGRQTVQYTIHPRTVTLTSASQSREYNGTPLTNAAVTIGGNGFTAGEGAACIVTGSQLDKGESENAFTYTLSGAARAANYRITAVCGTLTVTAVSAPITIAADSCTQVYTGAALTDSGYTYTPGVLVAGDILTADVSGSQTDVGIGENTVVGWRVLRGTEDVTADYTFAAGVSGHLRVLQAAGNVTIAPMLDKQYDHTAVDAAPAVTRSGDGAVTLRYYRVENGVQAQLAGAPRDAGSYRVVAEVAASRNYTAALSAPVDFAISPRPITITAADAASSYGSTPAALSAAITSGLAVCAGDELHIGAQTTVTAATPSGTYTITPVWDKTDNYAVTAVSGTYTVVDAEMPFTATGSVSVYDGKAHGIMITGPQGMTVRYGTEKLTAANYGTASAVPPAKTDAGSYTVWYYITADNYTDASGSVQIEITRAAQTIAAQNVSAEYDGAVHSVTAAVNTGSPLRYENNDRIAAGSTIVTIRAEGSENYLDASTTAILTVTRRAIVLTAGSDSRQENGTPLTCGAYALTVGSLADGDRITDVTMQGSITAPGRAANVIAGVTIRNRAGENVTDSYQIRTEEGLLTVSAAPAAPTKTAGPARTGTPAQTDGTAKTPDQTAPSPSAQTVPDESVSTDKTLVAGTGQIRVTIDCRNADGSRLDGEFSSSQQVVEVCADQTELAAVGQGETLEIRLNVDVDAVRTEAARKDGDTTIRGQFADGGSGVLTLGTFADLDLEKRLGQAEWTRLKTPGGQITVTIRIPDAVTAQGAYYCIAVPGKDGYKLLRDEDDDPDTITFTTDEFDSCAIVYAPAKAAVQGRFVLFNLAAMLVSLVLAAVCLLKKKKRRIPAAAAAVLALVVYLLRLGWGSLVLFDLWSLFFAAVLLAELYFCLRRERREDRKDTASAQ